MLKALWRSSLSFRRVIAVLSLGLAAGVFYIASNIPQTAALPNESIDKLAVAHASEEFRIAKPRIDPTDSALSFEGAANIGAEIWAQNASLTGSSVRFAALAPTGPARAVYAAADSTHGGPTSKDCRTSLAITRADGSNSPQSLRLWQQNSSRDDQDFRQIILSAPETALKIEVSTNSPGSGSCPRVLNLNQTVIPIPAGPVDLLVPPNQPITLLFSPIDSGQSPWSQKKDTFDGLSLGDGDLKADSIDLVSTTSSKTPILHVIAHKGTDGVTLHDLKLGAEDTRLSIGEDRENADAWANGQKFPVLDLVDKIQKNPVLGFFLAAVLIPGLWKWIQQSCFPNRKPDPSNAETPAP